MGTELQRAGIDSTECFELWNLTHPERIRGIHQAYIDAGTRCILTHTFQSNPTALRRHGLENKLHEINQAAVANARRAGKEGCYVIGDIGPFSDTSTESVRQLVDSFAGVDALLVETAADLTNLAAVAECAPAELPLFASFAFLRMNKTLQTSKGLTPEACASNATKLRLHAIGVNCGREIGMTEVIEIVKRFQRETDLPILARPNAGTPTRTGSGWSYPQSAQMMAEGLTELLATGVAMVGGCCGTTPQHIAAFRPIVDAWNARELRFADDVDTSALAIKVDDTISKRE